MAQGQGQRAVGFWLLMYIPKLVRRKFSYKNLMLYSLYLRACTHESTCRLFVFNGLLELSLSEKTTELINL